MSEQKKECVNCPGATDHDTAHCPLAGAVLVLRDGEEFSSGNPQRENIIGMRKKIKAQAEHITRLEFRIAEQRKALSSSAISMLRERLRANQDLPPKWYALVLSEFYNFPASQQGEQCEHSENIRSDGVCIECGEKVREAFGEIGHDGWRKIGKPAMVGATSFGVGISSRLVVEAAQRHYEYSQDPAVEAERMQRISNFVASVREEHPEQAEGAQGEREVTVTIVASPAPENSAAEVVHHALEYARKAGFIEAWTDPLAQPSPAQVYACPECGTGMQVDPSAKPSKAQPSPAPELVHCACGDAFPVNSYGAGFMDANNGVCQNCDAANSATKAPELERPVDYGFCDGVCDD